MAARRGGRGKKFKSLLWVKMDYAGVSVKFAKSFRRRRVSGPEVGVVRHRGGFLISNLDASVTHVLTLASSVVRPLNGTFGDATDSVCGASVCFSTTEKSTVAEIKLPA